MKGGKEMRSKAIGKTRKAACLLICLLMGCLCAVFAACTDKGEQKEDTATVETIEISNESELTAEWILGEGDRTVNVVFTPDTFTQENTQFTVQSSNPSVVSVNGTILSAVGAGSATITVSAGDASDTIEVTVSVGMPTLSHDEELQAVEGMAYSIGELVLAEACDGTDITENVVVTSESDQVVYDAEAHTISFTEKGEYDMTLTVADPRDATKTASGSMHVEVFRNPFSTTNTTFKLSNMFGEESAQTAMSTNSTDDVVYAYYNADPSKLYYAEATFDIGGTVDYHTLVGLGHFIEGDTNRMVGMVIQRDDKNFKIKDIDWTKTPDPTFDENAKLSDGSDDVTLYSYRIDEVRGYTDEESNHVKFAVARVGDYLYAFLNDQYVARVAFEYYFDKDTVPGLIGTKLNTTSVSGMTWLSGEDAQSKIDSLIQDKELIAYAPDNWASGAVSTYPDCVTNMTKDENGISFTYAKDTSGSNSGMVSPYIYFDGDFTLEWVYKNTGHNNPNGGKEQMYLEIRDYKYNAPILQFGERQNDGKFLLDKLPETQGSEVFNQPSFNDTSKWNGKAFDFSEGTRYVVTRTLTETCAEYRMTVISVADPLQRYSTTIEYDGQKWNTPVIFLWHNYFVSGEYSDIRWSTDPSDANDDPIVLENIAIANKSELAAEWILGDADRTVQLTFTPDLFTESNVEFTVESSDPNVVSADGKTLHAVAKGTAVITVRAGEFYDTVEVTVSIGVPSLEIGQQLQAVRDTAYPVGDFVTAKACDGTDLTDAIQVSCSESGFVYNEADGTIKFSEPKEYAVTFTVADSRDTTKVAVKTITIEAIFVETISISNKEELTAEWILGEGFRTVHVVYTPDIFTEETVQFSVESSNPDIVTVDGKALNAVGAGTVTITVRVEGASDTVEVTVGVGAPALTVAETLQALEGTEYSVKDFASAQACDKTDLTQYIVVSFEGTGVDYDRESGKLTFEEKGEYELTFTVADQRDETKTATRTVAVEVFRDPLSVSNTTFELSNLYGEESAQTASGTDASDSVVYAYYNADPSKLYYAEAMFDIGGTVDHQILVGLGHFVEGDTNRMVGMVIQRNDKNFKIKDIDWTKTPDPTFDENAKLSDGTDDITLYSYKIDSLRGYTDADPNHVKFAVARVGDYLYAFLNDQYVARVAFKYYFDKDTVPGIIGTKLNTASVSGMTWLSGDEAQGKVNALMANTGMVAYVPDTWANGSLNSYDTAVTNITNGENGMGFTYASDGYDLNASMVSPYLYFDGDFTLEWVYKVNTYDNPAGGQEKMYLEIRNYKYNNPILQFGEQWKDRVFILDKQPEDSDKVLNQPSFDDTSKWNGEAFDFSQGTHYVVTRTLTDTAAEYTMTVSSVAKPEQTYTVSFSYSGSRWNTPVLFLWHNHWISGEYSNIRWTTGTVSE